MFSAKLYLMAENNAFGEMVLKKRLELNLSQRALALKIGKSPTYITYVESGFNPSSKGGKFQASKEAVDAIAKVLRLDIDEARQAAGYAPKNTAETTEILDGAFVSFDERKFSKKEQTQLIEAMRLIALGVKAEKEREENE